MNGLTATELAAFLGVTPTRIRQIANARQIQPVGTRWKAKLYDPSDIIRHAGARDRLTTCANQPTALTLTDSRAIPTAV